MANPFGAAMGGMFGNPVAGAMGAGGGARMGLGPSQGPVQQGWGALAQRFGRQRQQPMGQQGPMGNKMASLQGMKPLYGGGQQPQQGMGAFAQQAAQAYGKGPQQQPMQGGMDYNSVMQKWQQLQNQPQPQVNDMGPDNIPSRQQMPPDQFKQFLQSQGPQGGGPSYNDAVMAGQGGIMKPQPMQQFQDEAPEEVMGAEEAAARGGIGPSPNRLDELKNRMGGNRGSGYGIGSPIAKAY